MGKTAFVFPGQGTQYVGMGKDFYENSHSCKEIYEMASKASGLDVQAICFEENDKIHITEYTQIAMLATEVAMLRELEERGLKADVTAGLSLGEYGALVASKVMTPAEVFMVIRKRGIFMQEAVPSGGAMTAVLGADTSVIEKICIETPGEVSIANYNCPGQVVITGEKTAVDAAAKALTEAGAKRCISLNVSGPFHSNLLAGAGEKLGEVLQGITIYDIQVPYITNVTADYVSSKEDVKELLVTQVSHPVKWQQTIENMIAGGVSTFIEIGPGKTLSGFIRKINKEVQIFNIEKWEDIDTVTQALL